MSDKWQNDVGAILESKKGNLYIKIESDMNLKKGENLTLKRKSDEINESVEAGKITEEEGQELQEKLHFVKYTIHRPPSNP